MVLNLGRLNHRMHNKLLVADNLIGIVGGRNVGNEYFGMSDKLNFRDFDLLAAGPVVPDISASFDIYWNSQWAYPLSVIHPIETDADDLTTFRVNLTQSLQDSEILKSMTWINQQDWSARFSHLKEQLFWGKARVIYDVPEHVNTQGPIQMAQTLGEVGQETKEELLVVSPYFVPRKKGVQALQRKREQGVTIKILTNSLASTDVVAAHSGYSPYRRGLLRAGVALYEFRHDARARSLYETPPAKADRIGLHTKSVIYDRKIVYVGSLNLDPRSARLNTEIGLLVESPPLANVVARLFEPDFRPENSWRVTLNKDNKLVWHSDTGATRTEPAYRFRHRISNFFFHLLPIKSQL